MWIQLCAYLKTENKQNVRLRYTASCIYTQRVSIFQTDRVSASEMTYIVSSGALNSTHSLTHRPRVSLTGKERAYMAAGWVCSWLDLVNLATISVATTTSVKDLRSYKWFWSIHCLFVTTSPHATCLYRSIYVRKLVVARLRQPKYTRKYSLPAG